MTSEQMCVCGHQRSVHTWHAEETDTPGCGLSSCSCGVFRTVQEEALTSQQESVHKHVWDGAYCACGAVQDQREAPTSNQQLKPCPFCGSLRIELKDNNYIWYVECADCRVACSVAQRLWPADMSIPVGAWNRRAHETTDDHEADLANQLREVDRAFRGCLKELDTLRARVPASDYVLVIDMGETHHKEYGQVLFATHDAIHAVEPRETTEILSLRQRINFALRVAKDNSGCNTPVLDEIMSILAPEQYGSPVEPTGILPPAFQSLLDLQPNWDSYGAKRINLACVQKAYEIWRQLAGIWLPVPHSDGTVGLEQHQGGFDIEIDVDLSLPPEKSSESSPDQLVGALQDRVHQDLGRVRAGRSVKASGEQS